MNVTKTIGRGRLKVNRNKDLNQWQGDESNNTKKGCFLYAKWKERLLKARVFPLSEDFLLFDVDKPFACCGSHRFAAVFGIQLFRDVKNFLLFS